MDISAIVIELFNFTKSINIWILIIPSAIAYIIAQILSSKTNCIVIWGWWDLVTFSIPGIIIYIILYNYIRSETLFKEYYNLMGIAFVTLFILTIIFSLIANKFNPIYFIISASLKIIEMIVIPIIIVLFIFALGSGKSDKRFKDGTRNNEKTMWLAFAGLIAYFLVGNLVKVERNKDA